MNIKSDLKKLFFIFLTWRVSLFIVGFLAGNFFPYAPSFPYASELGSYGLPHWLSAWAGFDGVHYLTIINKGYFGTGLIQAFFPLFPLLVKYANVINNPVATGLIISNVLAFASLISFYQIAKIFNPQKIWLSLIIFLAFPTSFFLGALYTESLFLILILQTFLATHYKKWWLAAVLAGLAGATKVVGIFAVVTVVSEFLFEKNTIWQLNKQKIFSAFKKIPSHWKNLLAILLVGSLGLLSYMTYLQLRYQDALYFLHVQSEFGGGRQESLVTYPQVVWRYVKILLTARPFDFKYFAYVQEAVAGTLVLISIFLASKKISFGWLIFCLGAFFVPTLTGTFSSLPRYILIIWPIYLVLANLINQKKWQILYLTISLGLLILNTMLFVQGYWVA